MEVINVVLFRDKEELKQFRNNIIFGRALQKVDAILFVDANGKTEIIDSRFGNNGKTI